MKKHSLLSLFIAGAAVAVSACSDSSSPSLTSDTELTADVAATAGDAIAADVGELIANENSVGAALPASTPGLSLFTPPHWSVSRSKVCYDAQNQAQAQCDAQTTASIVFNLTIDGAEDRSFTGPRGTESMSVAVHRTRQLTISGLVGTETSRTHDGFGASHDTTMFSGTHEQVTLTRVMTESSADTVDGVKFNLPRSTNPWPVEGQIIRNSAGNVDVTQGDRHESRSFTRRVVVTFPADAQGNVGININGKACTLNLVTHVVANCSGGST